MMFSSKRQPPEIVDGKPCKHGHGTKRYAKFGGCVECVRLANLRSLDKIPIEKKRNDFRAWTDKNRDYSNARRKDYAKRFPERHLLNAARQNSKKSNVPFDLKLSDIVIPERCPIFDIPLERGIGKRTWNSPSIDRIIPKLGYIKGNVVIVSWRANFLKSDGSVREFEMMIDFYKQMASKN